MSKPETIQTEVFLCLLRDLSLADHVGDMWNSIDTFLDITGIQLSENEGYRLKGEGCPWDLGDSETLYGSRFWAEYKAKRDELSVT